MYQGYSKTWYHQVKKISFEHTKKEVMIVLDACNIDIIQRFYNKSFRFINAYRKELSVKAAIQCVKKQKRYRIILENTLNAFLESLAIMEL